MLVQRAPGRGWAGVALAGQRKNEAHSWLFARGFRKEYASFTQDKADGYGELPVS